MWFHVEDMSSAHVYLRCKEGETWEDIPEQALEDCAQLCKANSIKGSKKATVSIVYTPWANLKKTVDMEVGAIGFHDEKNKKHRNCSRNKDILKALGRTKRVEEDPDLAEQRRRRDDKERARKKATARDMRKKERIEAEERKKIVEERSYKTLFTGGGAAGAGTGASAGAGAGDDLAKYKATEDVSAAIDYEDDFM